MKTLKQIQPGDIFVVKHSKCTMTGMTDHRTYKCIDETHILLVKPSDSQINADEWFRKDWSPDKETVVEVDPKWYPARGFEVKTS